MFEYRNDRHKNDCGCAVCQVTRRKKERDETLSVDNEIIVVNNDISEEQNMEVRINNLVRVPIAFFVSCIKEISSGAFWAEAVRVLYIGSISLAASFIFECNHIVLSRTTTTSLLSVFVLFTVLRTP